MGIENYQFNEKNRDSEELKKEGKSLLLKMKNQAEELNDKELEDLYIEIDDIMKKLNGRDYIELSATAVHVFRAVGKQVEAEQLIKENKERYKN